MWFCAGLLVFLFWSPSVALVPDGQLFALEDLYHNTNGAEWASNDGWMSGDPCFNSWFGIECTVDDTILTIELPENNLQGSLLSSIGSFPDLELLDLEGNTMGGEIPTTIAQLSSLIELNFNTNSFIGDIPTELGLLPQLEELGLEENQVGGTLPSELGNILSLIVMVITETQLRGTLPSEFGRLINLVELELDNNFLNGTLPTEIGLMTSIEQFDIDANEFSGTVPEEIGNMVELRELDLDLNFFSGTFPTVVGRLTFMEELDLNDNRFSGTLPTEIGLLVSLIELDLEQNRFEGPIPTEFGDLVLLEELAMNLNLLNGTLPTEIGKMSSLIEIHLQENSLVGTFPSEITLLENLEVIKLQENQLSGFLPTDPGVLPVSSLFLFLNKNSFWGDIPPWILDILEYDLRYNFLIDCEPSCIIKSTCEALTPETVILDNINATWLEKQTSFLGSAVEVLEVEVQFPLDLYAIDSIVCQNSTFTSMETGVEPIISSECGELTKLNVNESLTVDFVDQNHFQPYYLETEDNHQTISIRVIPITGEPDLYLSYQQPVCFFGEADVSSALEGRDQIIVCPSQPRTNVIYFSVFASNSVVGYTLEIISLDLPLLREGSGAVFINQERFTAIDGQPVTIFNRGVEMVFTAGDVSPFSCFLHAEVLEGGTVAVEINGKYYTSAPAFTSVSRSFIDVSVCPSDYSGGPIPEFDLNIYLFASTEIDLSFLYTTAPYVKLVLYSSLPVLDSMNRLSQSECIFLTSSCDTEDVWIGTSSNAFNPPRPSLFSNEFIDIFLDGEWIYPEYKDVSPRSVYAYFLFPQNTNIRPLVERLGVSFGACIVDDQGHTLVEPDIYVSPQPKAITCNYEENLPLLDLMSQRVTALINLQISGEPFSRLVELDIIRYNTIWSACERQTDSFLNHTTEDETAAIDTLKIEEECSDPDCSQFFFADYLLNRNLVTEGNCTENLIASRTSQWYHSCKALIYSFDKDKVGRACFSDLQCQLPALCSNGTCYANSFVSCTSDSECVIETSCDYLSGVCVDSQEVAETLMLRCYIDLMTTATQTILAISANLTEIDKYSNNYIQELRKAATTEDCVSIVKNGMSALTYRFHYIHQLSSQDSVNTLDDCACYHSIGETYDLCFDELCNLPVACQSSVYDDGFAYDDSDILKNDGCIYSLLETPQSDLCLSVQQCNWNPNLETTSPSSNESDVCSSGNVEFCGVRLDETVPLYQEIAQLPLESCETQRNVCVSPNGGLMLGLNTEEECLNFGLCRGFCQSETPQCVPIDPTKNSVCFRENISALICANGSGIYSSSSGICVYKYRNSGGDCVDNDYEAGLVLGDVIGAIRFLSCDSFGAGDCQSYDDPSLLECLVAPVRECHNEQECETGLGLCSDVQVFPEQGICVLPFIVATDRKFCFVNMTVTNIGCGNPDIGREECEANEHLGWVYHFPSFTVEECESYGYGCRTGEFIETGLLISFYTNPELFPTTSREDTERQCKELKGSLRPLFDWTRGEWSSGKLTPTIQREREMIFTNQIQPTLDFIFLSSTIAESIEVENFSRLQNLALCATSYSLISALNETSCACAPQQFEGYWGDGVILSPVDLNTETSCVDNCSDTFEVCPGLVQIIQTPFASIIFRIEGQCVDVEISSSPYQTFAQPVVVPIALSFVPVRGSNADNTFSTVVNKKEEIVGQIMGDVLRFNRTFESYVPQPYPTVGIELVLVCQICISGEDVDPLFTVYDLGRGIGTDENGNTLFRPLGLVGNFSEEHMVVQLSGAEMNDDELELVLIKRVASYQSYSVVSDAERSILITSSALFGTAALLIILMLAAFYRMYQTVEVFSITIQCFLVMTIRCLYFSLLVGEEFEAGSLTDYILIEIPTFFYLQVLLQILVAISFIEKRLNEEKKRDMWLLTLFLWFLVWLGFAAVIIAISQTEGETIITSTCDCRITSATRGSDHSRLIRIIYKSFISALALLVFFLIGAMGRKTGADQSGVVKQITLVSFFLVLDCLAFVIYYAIDEPSPYFSIVLWFTELIPLVLLCWWLCRPGIKLVFSASRTTFSFVSNSLGKSEAD